MNIEVAGQIVEAFLDAAPWGGPPGLSVERLHFDARGLISDTMGRRCHWIAAGGTLETSVIRAEVLEPPRVPLRFTVFDTDSETYLVPRAASCLVAEMSSRLQVAHRCEADPDAHVFVFGGLLTKEWVGERPNLSGQLDVSLGVRGELALADA